MLDTATVDQAARLLLGGIPPMSDELTRRRMARALPERHAPAGSMPFWATIAVQLGDEVVYAHPTPRPGRRRGAGCSAVASRDRDGVPGSRGAHLRSGRGRRRRIADPLRVAPARRLSAALLDAAAIVKAAQ